MTLKNLFFRLCFIAMAIIFIANTRLAHAATSSNPLNSIALHHVHILQVELCKNLYRSQKINPDAHCNTSDLLDSKITPASKITPQKEVVVINNFEKIRSYITTPLPRTQLCEERYRLNKTGKGAHCNTTSDLLKSLNTIEKDLTQFKKTQSALKHHVTPPLLQKLQKPQKPQKRYYSISPFMSLRKFKESSSKVGHEFGGAFTKVITQRVSIQGALSLLSYSSKQESSDNSINKNTMIYTLNTIIDMNPGKPLRLKPSIGITDGFSTEDSFSLRAGIGLDFYLNNNIIIQTNIVNEKDWIFTFGFAKQFNTN
jgi:hypothetical protein